MARNKLIGETNFISGNERDRIEEEISNIFGSGTYEILSLNIQELRNKIDTIINKVELLEYKETGDSNKKYRIKNETDSKLLMMADAYFILFQVREFLTGESINYRYYYNTSEGRAGVIEFQEKDLIDYIKFGKNALEIAQGRIKKQGESNQKYQNLLDSHYKNLYAGLKDATTSGRKVVHSYIMHRYEETNAGLRNKEDPRLYQLFTMGHFFEALDIAFSEAIAEGKEDDFSFMEKSVYGTHLYYDNIEGLKGGDNANTMTQIKANAATILRYNTILNSLKDLRDILNVSFLNRKEIVERVKNLYLHESKYKDIEAFEQAAQAAANKLIEVLKIDQK